MIPLDLAGLRRGLASKRNRIAFLRSPNLRSEVQAYLTASDALSGRLAEVGGSPGLKHPAEDSCPFGTEATNRRTRTRPRPRSHTSMWGVGSPKPNIGPKPNSTIEFEDEDDFYICAASQRDNENKLLVLMRITA